MLWAIALAGCAAATVSLVAVLRNPLVGPELGEPLVIALLRNWLTLSYVLCGLYRVVAAAGEPLRRPDGRRGVRQFHLDAVVDDE